MTTKSKKGELSKFVTEKIRSKGGTISAKELRQAIVQNWNIAPQGAVGTINGLVGVSHTLYYVGKKEDGVLALTADISDKISSTAENKQPHQVSLSEEIAHRLYLVGQTTIPRTRQFPISVRITSKGTQLEGVHRIVIETGGLTVEVPLGASLTMCIGVECQKGFEKGQVLSYPGPATLKFLPDNKSSDYIIVDDDDTVCEYIFTVPDGQTAYISPDRQEPVEFKVNKLGISAVFPSVFGVALSDNDKFEYPVLLPLMWNVEWFLNHPHDGAPQIPGPISIGMLVSEPDIPKQLRSQLDKKRNKLLTVENGENVVWVIAFDLSQGEFISQTVLKS